MPYIFIPLISLAVVFAGLVGVYNFVPLSAFEPLSFSEPMVGTTVATINGSDTLSASRTVINNNFTALNAGKIEISTTTLPLLTTLLNLSSVGTITTGTWNADAISVSKGGSGTTSPSTWQVILGNGASGFTVASGTGVAGQFLTSNGANAYPSWQTSAVDAAIDYSWTGNHTFAIGTLFNGTTTQNATSTFGGRLTNSTAAIDGTASTTIYGDLKVMGAISASGDYYGGRYPCAGRILVTDDSSGSYSSSVTCGFSVKTILFNARNANATDKNVSSTGLSNNTANYSNAAFVDNAGAQFYYVSATSSVMIQRASGGSVYGVYGTASSTATGFTLNYTVNAASYTDDVYVDYIAY